MDKGLIASNFADEVGRDGTQGIHGHETAHPGGAHVRNIRALPLCGNADQLRPGIAPFHALEIHINACLTLECGYQAEQSFRNQLLHPGSTRIQCWSCLPHWTCF